jgi:hypothetical protein
MASLRKGWQDFKKAYPEFEKSKELKADFGPQLDRFEDAKDKLNAAVQQVVKLATDYDKARQNMVVAATGYEVVVKKLAKTTPDLQKDFDHDFGWVTAYANTKGLAKVVYDLQGLLEKEPE